MKILCPIDFSVTSVDAVRYAVAMSAKFDHCKIEFLNCVYTRNHDRIFRDEIAFLESRATMKMQRLTEEILRHNPSIEINQIVLKGDPVELILRHNEENDFDYTIIGSKGMRSAKDRPIGSITASLFERARCPVLAVPQAYVFHSLDNVVLAVDSDPISSQKVLAPLLKLVNANESHLELLHVHQKEDQKLAYDLDFDRYLSGVDYDYYSKFTKDTVNKAINQVCRHVNADMLCMIHRDRSWILDLFHRSQIKEELFHISMPILILRD